MVHTTESFAELLKKHKLRCTSLIHGQELEVADQTLIVDGHSSGLLVRGYGRDYGDGLQHWEYLPAPGEWLELAGGLRLPVRDVTIQEVRPQYGEAG